MAEILNLQLREDEIVDQLIVKLKPILDSAGVVVYLYGDVGVGKTALVRLLLQSYGCNEVVTSPSFNLLNYYDLDPVFIHCDLYRFNNFAATEMLMLEDYFGIANYLIEWPEHAVSGAIPQPDVSIKITNYDHSNYRYYEIKLS